MQKNFWPTSIDPFTPSQLMSQPAHVERKVAARWEEWEPWVLLDLHRRCLSSVPTVRAESARLRKRHRMQVLDLLRAGIEMRLIRKHKLDDPRMTDEEHAAQARAAIERRTPSAGFPSP